MVCLHVRKLQTVAIALAGILCVATSEKLAAQSTTAPNVTYAAAGTFATPQISGNDLFQLQGQAFSIDIVANAALPPTTHGGHWARYTKLKMKGSVGSGLEPTPIAIMSGLTSLEIATGNPSYDQFVVFAPVNAFGIEIDVLAYLQTPPGTVASALIHPFSSVTLKPCTHGTTLTCVNTVVYSDPNTGNSTTLGIDSGTLVATIPHSGGAGPDGPLSLQLHLGGAQVISSHSDGSKVARLISAKPVNLSGSSDTVALQFFASGVRGGTDVHVQVAGRDVPVVFSGPAQYFAGLDQVTVKVPRSLLASDAVDVVLTVDGHMANPLHVQLQ